MKNVIVLFLMLLYSFPAYSTLNGTHFKYASALDGASEPQNTTFRKLPKKALDLLKRHDVWQTSAGLKVDGQAPLLLGHRKWSVNVEASSFFLVEKTELMAEEDCVSKKRTRWTSGKINLLMPLDIRDFFLGNPISCGDKTEADFLIKYLTEDRFIIYPKKTGFALLFFPSQNAPVHGLPISDRPAHILTAPGVNQALLQVTELAHKEVAYLHHDLQRSMPVYVDSTFPVSYLSLLEQSLGKWNSVLRTQFFVLQPSQVENLDSFDCISSRKLCIFWNGPKNISFLGATALTSITFDPENGEIIGGYIGIASDAEEKPDSAPPSPIIDRFINEKTTLADIAQLYSNREILKKLNHPAPVWQLGYVITHELGHFNGLAHNFSGDNMGGSFRVQKSVMDYLPFGAVNSTSGDIGIFDVEAIRLIYSNVSLPQGYHFCGDLNASSDGVSSDPNCNQFDLGSPDEWFIQLAKVSSDGVFSPHPRFKGILLDYLAGFLPIGKPSVSVKQRHAVTQYLCGLGESRKRAVDYLNEKWKISLLCPEAIEAP